MTDESNCNIDNRIKLLEEAVAHIQRIIDGGLVIKERNGLIVVEFSELENKSD